MVIIGCPNESDPCNALADMSPTHQTKQHRRNRPTLRPNYDQRICQRMLLIPGTGNGERGTGNGSLGTNVQRQPASEFKMAVKTKERLEEKQFG